VESFILEHYYYIQFYKNCQLKLKNKKIRCSQRKGKRKYIMAKNYSKSRTKLKKRKRYSLLDRISYYRGKSHSKNKKSKAFSIGYADGASGSLIDSSIFDSDMEKETYFQGVEKGTRALNKSRTVKF
jgi:hypothetical protein